MEEKEERINRAGRLLQERPAARIWNEAAALNIVMTWNPATLHMCKHISVSLAVNGAAHHNDRLDSRDLVPLKGWRRMPVCCSFPVTRCRPPSAGFLTFFPLFLIKQLIKEEFRGNVMTESRGALTVTLCASGNGMQSHFCCSQDKCSPLAAAQMYKKSQSSCLQNNSWPP